MQIKGFKGKDSYIPDSAYLAFSYYRFFSLDDSEDRKNYVNDRIKRFKAIIDERLKQGLDITDVSTLLQLTTYFYGFTEESTIPFFPNLSCFINDDVFKPYFLITKALIKHGFLTPDSGMLFENKFIIGFENRIFDGMPIIWNGDINSIVTLIYILFLLRKIETNDNFDTMIHRNRPKRKKTVPQKHGGLVFPNVTTLIAGKYTKEKTAKGNFLISGIDSYKKWHTINRRCEGIRKQLMSFFGKMIGNKKFEIIPKEEILDYLIKNKDSLNFLSLQKWKGKSTFRL